MSTNSSQKACVVSIEVDGRQKYLFETDKLREMLGASRIIHGTREQAKKMFKAPLFVLSPVSGEIRAWCFERDRNELLEAAWGLREWLNQHGVEHTIAFLGDLDSRHFENDKDIWTDASLSEVHRDISRSIRSLKSGKIGADARPRCSLFAACQIHGLDSANQWNPDRDKDDETRRELVGFRAAAKLEVWTHDRRGFYQELLKAPILQRIKELRPELYASVETAGVTFSDLSDTSDLVQRGDQYIGFICADGDGLGRVLAGLSWNDTTWKDGDNPWRRSHRFSLAVDDAVRLALGKAIAVATFPNSPEGRKRLDDLIREVEPGKSVPVKLTVLPQLCGGEDVWVVADREDALRLIVEFGIEYTRLAQDSKHSDGIIGQAKTLANDPENLTMSFGVAFAKAGHPVHAMVEAAETLLKSAKALRKGNLQSRGRPKPDEGCIDWDWIESSLSEDVADARAYWRYTAEEETLHLTTKPWTIGETERFVKAAELLAHLPRRKREQFETIVRLGRELSALAWESWWKGLLPRERDKFVKVNEALPESLRLLDPKKHPWRDLGDKASPRWVTPVLDLLALQHVLGLEGRQLREPENVTKKEAANAQG